MREGSLALLDVLVSLNICNNKHTHVDLADAAFMILLLAGDHL